MYIKMDNLDIYNDSAIILNRKTSKKIFSWITILIMLTILFIIFSFVPFNIYKVFVGYVNIDKNNSYIILNLNDSDFPIDKKNKLYIKNKEYSYKIMKIDGNIVSVNILKDRTTLFKIIINKIKKGFDA